MTVGSSGDFATVRLAVAGASGGDTLLLEPGVFGDSATIGISKDLVFSGATSGGATVFKTGATNMFSITGATVRFEDITFSNVNRRVVRADFADVTLLRTRVTGARADHGAVIWSDFGSVAVLESEFYDSVATGWGGSIWAKDTDVYIADSLFNGSHAQEGGGVRTYRGDLLIERTEFVSNRISIHNGTTYGGAISGVGT